MKKRLSNSFGKALVVKNLRIYTIACYPFPNQWEWYNNKDNSKYFDSYFSLYRICFLKRKGASPSSFGEAPLRSLSRQICSLLSIKDESNNNK